MHLWRSYILYLVLAPDANALAPDATAEDVIADNVNAKAYQFFQLQASVIVNLNGSDEFQLPF
jgi:hypothetical protein